MKHLFALVSFLCILESGFAQQTFFGLDAGVNLSTLRMQTTTSGVSTVFYNDNVLRSSIGAFYQLGLSNKFSLRLGARYLGLGYKSETTYLTTPPSTNIDYLTFQVALNYHITKRLQVAVAPYLSFTIGGTPINNQEITKTFHKNDHGISLGAEYDIYKNFSLGLHYYVGIKNIILNDSLNGVEIYDTNRAFQVLIGYKFRKKI
jgi:predicted porin